MCSKTLKCVSDLKGWECIKNMENDMARNTERDEREATRRKEQRPARPGNVRPLFLYEEKAVQGNG